MSRDRIRPIPELSADDIRRFWSQVVTDGDCWVWTGVVKSDGYGRFSKVSSNGRQQLPAHRVAWHSRVGPIPDGLLVLHSCDTPRCVRPDHLFLGTHKDNMADMASKARGRTVRGARHRSARFDVETVRLIRRMHRSGQPIRAIARQFNVTPTAVRSIVKRRTWAWLED